MSEQVMTKQEIFDAVVKGLAKQGRPATDNMLRCEDGSRCAIGLLLTDEEIDIHSFMDCTVNGTHLPPRIGSDSETIILLETIQDAHDRCGGQESNDEVFCNLRRVAKHHRFNTKAIDEATSGQG